MSEWPEQRKSAEVRVEDFVEECDFFRLATLAKIIRDTRLGGA
jgi:hypothetical protein